MTTMAKMTISISLLAIGIYVSWYVRFGELTFREHVGRIASTPEVHDLGRGMATAIASAKTAVQTRLSERLSARRAAAEGEPVDQTEP